MALSIAKLEYGDLIAYTWSTTVVEDGKAVTKSKAIRTIYLGMYDTKHILCLREEASEREDWQLYRGTGYEEFVENGEIVGKYQCLEGRWVKVDGSPEEPCGYSAAHQGQGIPSTTSRSMPYGDVPMCHVCAEFYDQMGSTD